MAQLLKAARKRARYACPCARCAQADHETWMCGKSEGEVQTQLRSRRVNEADPWWDGVKRPASRRSTKVASAPPKTLGPLCKAQDNTSYCTVCLAPTDGSPLCSVCAEHPPQTPEVPYPLGWTEITA